MAPSRVFGAIAGRAFMAAAAKSAAKKKPAPFGGAPAKTPAKKTVTVKKTVTPRVNTGIQKVVPVSSELGNFIGASEVSRTEAIKKVWTYIKLQNLQNPSNKKEVFCDEKLKTIFYVKDKGIRSKEIEGRVCRQVQARRGGEMGLLGRRSMSTMGLLGRRSMSTVAKAVQEITGIGNTKIRKSSSELCNFLGIPRHSRSEISLILSNFIKLYNFRSPGIKKDKIWEQNLQTLLRGRNSVGFPEIAKILSPEFSQGAINVKDSTIDSSMDSTKSKGKGPQKKGKSSKK